MIPEFSWTCSLPADRFLFVDNNNDDDDDGDGDYEDVDDD